MPDRVPEDSQWREIPMFPNYYISQYGDVFNMKRGSMVSWHLNQHSVRSVRMYSHLAGTVSRGYMRSTAKLVREVWPAASVL